MENIRERINVELINNAKDYIRCVSKPSFVSQKIFSRNFVAIHITKPVLIFNKPVYAGFSIIDLSKLLMYGFHYKYIINKFDSKLLFTDADSIVYEIETEHVYEDFCKDKNLFDFTGYPLNSKFLIQLIKKLLTKMKDDLKRKIISELVGLKSKMYSLISIYDEEVT